MLGLVLEELLERVGSRADHGSRESLEEQASPRAGGEGGAARGGEAVGQRAGPERQPASDEAHGGLDAEQRAAERGRQRPAERRGEGHGGPGDDGQPVHHVRHPLRGEGTVEHVGERVERVALAEGAAQPVVGADEAAPSSQRI
jgi:hypothetical protein